MAFGCFLLYMALRGKVWGAERRPFYFLKKEVTKLNRELVYIISPYAGDTEANVAFAICCCRMAIQQGYTPIAVHLLYPQILNDLDPAERAIGLQLGLDILRHCDEAWVCGSRISPGMEGEIQTAHQLGIPIRYEEGAI